MEQERRRLQEIHRRFAFGILMGLPPEELRPFVTGDDDEEQGGF